MKILHLLACPLDSGAGKAVKTLHTELLKNGIRSTVAGRIEKDLDPFLGASRIPLSEKIISGAIRRLQVQANRIQFGETRDVEFLQRGVRFDKLRAYREADLIHVQWANATSMGSLFWKQLFEEKRPIIWTLRDMWPFTGGCHFSGSCDRFEQNCGDCPKIHRPAEQETARQLEFKSAYLPRSATFVAISNHFAETARRSNILKGCDIRVIPNSVDAPAVEYTQEDAREALGLPEEKVVLSSGALNLSEPRKGATTLKRLLKEHANTKNIEWLLFGGGFEMLDTGVIENCRVMGKTFDVDLITRIYVASDLFVMPSLQESFGKVTLEAMLAGKAVVAFRDTPAEDMIIDGQTGWLVRHGDTNGFVAAVNSAVALGREILRKIGAKAREETLKNYLLADTVNKHIRLYEEKLSYNIQ